MDKHTGAGFQSSLPSLYKFAPVFLVDKVVTIAILGAIESLLSATVADGVISDHHDSNTELVAQG